MHLNYNFFIQELYTLRYMKIIDLYQTTEDIMVANEVNKLKNYFVISLEWFVSI